MAENPRFLAALLLALTLSAAGCDRAEGPGKDKIDELPRGTGGTPATQATQPTP